MSKLEWKPEAPPHYSTIRWQPVLPVPFAFSVHALECPVHVDGPCVQWGVVWMDGLDCRSVKGTEPTLEQAKEAAEIVLLNQLAPTKALIDTLTG